MRIFIHGSAFVLEKSNTKVIEISLTLTTENLQQNICDYQDRD